jgi:hypothetical protein
VKIRITKVEDFQKGDRLPTGWTCYEVNEIAYFSVDGTRCEANAGAWIDPALIDAIGGIEVERAEELKPFRGVVQLGGPFHELHRVYADLPLGTPVAVVPLPLPEEIREWAARVEPSSIENYATREAARFLRSLEGE